MSFLAAHYLLLLATGWKRNISIHPPVQETDCKPHQHHNAHHSFERNSPTINTRTQIFPQIGEILHCTTREYKSNICPKTKQGIKSFCFINCSYLHKKTSNRLEIDGRKVETIISNIKKNVYNAIEFIWYSQRTNQNDFFKH